MKIINAYAPHGGYSYDTRQMFFSQLGQVLDDTNSFGLKLVVGDLNSRIHRCCHGEEDLFGQYCFGKACYNPGSHPEYNREFLLEMCVANGLCVANTFLDIATEHQVTYLSRYLAGSNVRDYPSRFCTVGLVVGSAGFSLETLAVAQRPATSIGESSFHVGMCHGSKNRQGRDKKGFH